MKNQFKISVIALMVITLSACSSGGSQSTSTPSTSTINTVTIDASKFKQYAMPQVMYGVNLATWSNFFSAAVTPSISITNFTISGGPWWQSGTFDITNSSSVAQNLTLANLYFTSNNANDILIPSNFQINSFTPWQGANPSYTLAQGTTNNQIQITLKNSISIPAASSVGVAYGYNPNGVNQGPFTVSIGSSNTPPPPPVQNATLNVTVNSSALNGICTTVNPCNIPINLLNSDHSVYAVVTTITTVTGQNTYTISNIPAGTYTLAAANLPATANIQFSPSNSLQLSAGQSVSVGALFGIIGSSSSNCLNLSNAILNGTAWWMNGSFTLNNTCTTAQSLSGLLVNITTNNPNDSFMPSSVAMNQITPYLPITLDDNLTTNNSTVLPLTLVTSSSLQANSSVTINFGMANGSTPLQGLATITLAGSTPVQNASLNVLIDSSALSGICTTVNPCNIPINLYGQSGQLLQTITTITNVTSKTNYNIINLNPGIYSIAPSKLPANITVNDSNSTLHLNSGESTVAAPISFNVIPPTTGTLNITLTNPNTSLFTMAGLPVKVQGSTTVLPQVTFGVSTPLASLVPGAYTVSVNGLASSSGGLYYAYAPVTTTISAGQVTNAALVATAQTNLVTESITVKGLNPGDSATLVFTDSINGYSYTFNSESITGVTESVPVTKKFQFIKNDTITINVNVNSNYNQVAPYTLTAANNGNLEIDVSPIQNGQPVVPPTASGIGQIVGYFETWLATGTWESATYSLAEIPAYVNTIPLAFAKPDSSYVPGSALQPGATSAVFQPAGLGFAVYPNIAIGAIKVAQSKGQKVLLSVGGATYPNFAGLNVAATIGLVKDLGLDGIDIDFETDPGGCSNLNTSQLSCSTDASLISTITQLRAGLDAIPQAPGHHMTLSAAVWSIGAYGTPTFPTTIYIPVGSRSGMWVNPLKQVGNKLDEIFLMSYDAGSIISPAGSPTGYVPLNALAAYKAIYSGSIYGGLEVPPEAWGGDVTTVNQALIYASNIAQQGESGIMLWALEVQGNANGSNYNSMTYLQPICLFYAESASLCNQAIPLN